MHNIQKKIARKKGWCGTVLLSFPVYYNIQKKIASLHLFDLYRASGGGQHSKENSKLSGCPWARFPHPPPAHNIQKKIASTSTPLIVRNRIVPRNNIQKKIARYMARRRSGGAICSKHNIQKKIASQQKWLARRHMLCLALWQHSKENSKPARMCHMASSIVIGLYNIQKKIARNSPCTA